MNASTTGLPNLATAKIATFPAKTLKTIWIFLGDGPVFSFKSRDLSSRTPCYDGHPEPWQEALS